MHTEFAPALARAGFDADGGGVLRPSELAGRRPLAEIDGDGVRLVVRRYHHGGMFRWLTRARYFDASRAFEEIVVSDALARAGVRTPRVVAARAVRAAAGGYHLAVVSVRIEGSLDGGVVLERMRAGDVQPARRARLVRAAGELLGRATRAGLRHDDLGPRNLLVDAEALVDGPVEPFVLDLDGARLLAPNEPECVRANLGRLHRGAVRREIRGRRFLTPRDGARLLAGFVAGSGLETRVVRAAWDEIGARYRRARVWHDLGRRAERAFGGGPETRDGGAVVRS